MRNILRLVALAGTVLAFSPACSTKKSGQIMLAVQTDMSLPKDIDRVRIEVTRADSGAIIYQNDFERLGTEKSIRLPATLGITSPEDETIGIKVRVIATHGSGDRETVRVLREIVTKIPTDRVATLPVSLEFLCNGSGEAERDDYNRIKRDSSGVVIVKNTCPDERTCVAGLCVESEVPEESLPVYAEAQVFGGGKGSGDGTCFDTSTCFNGGVEAALDLDAFRASKETVCETAAKGDINIALRTQGGGICGLSGCFVALDADGPSGWKPAAAGRIALPAGVCAKAIAGEVVGLVTAPVDGAKCQKKQISLPTCGPWSATDPSASMPDPKEPTLVAPGQTNPVALAIVGNQVAWTSRGTFDKSNNPNSDGTVKIVSLDGGQPLTIAAGQASPHDIAVDAGRGIVVWTNAGSQQIMCASVADAGGAPTSKALLDKLLQPEGIAVNAPEDDKNVLNVFWTELASQKVYKIATTVSTDGGLEIADGATPTELLQPSPAGSSPRGIAAAKNATCWTYEDKLMTSDGVVACSLANKTVTVASQQRTPRAIALSLDSNGDATAVYWANFDALSKDPTMPGGEIRMAEISGTTLKPSVRIAEENYPAGLAVDPDGQTLYWTSRSSLGTVKSKSLKPGAEDVAPIVLADKQKNPGSIVATADVVLWINEGGTNLSEGAAPDGAIMKISKVIAE